MREEDNIYLIGFMGVGKSTVSKQLREITQHQEIDTDAEISRREQISIPDIFDTRGEDYFRMKETALLEELSRTNKKIVSCGGGIVLRENNIELMKKSGTVVLLTAMPETIYERVKSGTDRPLLNGNMNASYIEKMMKKRELFYNKAQTIKVSTDNKDSNQIAIEILELIKVSTLRK